MAHRRRRRWLIVCVRTHWMILSVNLIWLVLDDYCVR